MAFICPNCRGSNYDENNVCLDCGYFINGLPEGTLLDNRYEIRGALKAGGMGAVYLAFDTRLQQICAVKEMFNSAGGSNEKTDYIIKRFMEEAQLLAGLSHPSIPRVIDYFNEGETKYYLVMDYIEGCDLNTYVIEKNDGSGLAEELVLEWAIQVCDVLHYLHNQPNPILHRDLKPSNLILRDKDQRIMLIDFGLARTINLQTHTQKTVVGTMGYAPLEQYQGHPEPRSDIYSLGATMHFLLSAEESMPFKFLPIRELRQNISPWMERVIQKSLSLKPDNRFSSAEEMYRVLIGEVPIEELIFSPDDTSGLDMSFIHKEKPAREKVSRPLRISGGIRQVEEQRDYSADKIITLAMNSRDKKWLEPLVKILQSDPYDTNRRNSASALGHLNDTRALEPLIEAINDPDEHLRVNAVWALGEIGDASGAETLFSLYKKDENKRIVKAAKESLIKIGRKRKFGEPVEFILELIDQEDTGYVKMLPDNKDLYFDSPGELLIELLKDNERIKVRFHLGLIYYYKGNLDDALRHFKRAYQFNERQPEILYFRGRVYYDKRDLPQAIDLYEQSLKLDSCYMEAQGALIDAYYDLARKDARRGIAEEVEHYKKIISNFPEHPETTFIEGLLAMKEKNKGKAITYFTEYIEKNPEGVRIKECHAYLEELRRNVIFKIAFKLKEILKKK